jgi:uncharacterized caspase-like protein
MGEGKKRALLIGINEYDNPGFDKLNYAAEDANDIYRTLTDKEIGGFDQDDVILLVDNPTRTDLEKNLSTILKNTQPDDLFLMYFAGHGKLDKSGKLCLATRDTQVENLRITSVPLDNIIGMIEETRCKNTVFIIDSCYSGAAEESYRGGAPVPNESFADFASGPGKIIISASQTFGGARESKDLGHGVFTHYLVKGLEGEADDGENPYISIDNLYEYISEKVKAKTNNSQEPKKWPENGENGVFLAKSTKHKKRIEIESSTNTANELINDGKLDEAWDALTKANDLHPENNKVLLEVQQLMDKMKFDFIDYEVRLKDRKFSTAILDKALGMLREPFLNLEGIEKEYIRLVARLLSVSGLSLVNFELIWERLENPEKGSRTKADEDARRGDRDEGPKAGVKQEPKSAKEKAERSSTDDPKGRLVEPRAVKRDLVFISYSHRDDEWLDEFKTTLMPLERKGLKLWDDSKIAPGEVWRDEIKKALNAAKVAVLLVSKHFLASDFIRQNELPPLIESAKDKGVPILWVYLSECLYKEMPEIEAYQATHDISRPLESLTKPKRNRLIRQICEEIMKAAKVSLEN